MKTITFQAWAVINPFARKGSKLVLYDSGYPMIYVQKVKPKVVLYGEVQEVLPITISYTPKRSEYN